MILTGKSRNIPHSTTKNKNYLYIFLKKPKHNVLKNRALKYSK